MAKKVEKTINVCAECPYCRWSSKSSTFNCYKNNQIREIADEEDIFLNGWPEIPDWCPLPESEEK